MGAREYDPRTGRWLQRDPIEAASGDPNLWRYCGNDPLNGVDPSGLWSTGSYLGDVGAVFKGYGNAIAGIVISPWTMYEYFRDNGVSWSSAKNLVVGSLRSLWDGLSGTNPEAFGEAGFTVLMTATPGIKKIPSPKKRVPAAIVASNTPARPAIIYRAGRANPGNLKTRSGEDGLSFRDSLSNPCPLVEGQQPVFRPGSDYIAVSVEKLPEGSVIFDDIPPGHVSVKGVSPEDIIKAIVEKGRFPK